MVMNTGLESSIRNIAYEESGKYLIKQQYLFYPAGDSLIIIPQSELAKHKSKRFYEHWKKPFGFYEQVNQGEEIWYYKNKQIYVYDTLPGILLKFDYTPPADIISLKSDDNYLYLVCKTTNILMVIDDTRFIVVNKNWLRNNAVMQEPERTKEERLFELEKNNLYREYWNASFNELIEKTDNINNKYSKSFDKYITEQLVNINQHLRLIAFNDDLRNEAIRRIKIDTIQPGYLEPILCGLVEYFYIKSDIDSVLYYDSIFTLADSSIKWKDKVYKSSISKVKEVKAELVMLDSVNLAPDELLWKKAVIYKKLVYSDWNCGEGGCNPEMYFRFYRELIEKHPKSEYTDDAEYIILHSNLGAAQEGGELSSNLEFVEKFNDFIEKYPDSKYKSDALFILAGLYSSAEVSWAKLYEFNKIALEISYRIQNEFPEYEKNMYLPHFIEEIKRNLPLLALNLSIKPDKTVYNAGDPIYITFELTNTYSDTNSIDIKGLDSIPIALIYVFDKFKRKFKFENSKYCRDYRWKTLTLAPGETYTEKWDITRIALLWKEAYNFNEDYILGDYTFPKGKYEITAYLYPYIQERYMHSEPIYIEIK